MDYCTDQKCNSALKCVSYICGLCFELEIVLPLIYLLKYYCTNVARIADNHLNIQTVENDILKPYRLIEEATNKNVLNKKRTLL